MRHAFLDCKLASIGNRGRRWDATIYGSSAESTYGGGGIREGRWSETASRKHRLGIYPRRRCAGLKNILEIDVAP